MSDIQEKILELMDLFDEDEVTTADKINRPEPKQSVKEIELFNEFNIRNPKAGGGMLVQPSADGSRPGYAKDDVTYTRKWAEDRYNTVKDINSLKLKKEKINLKASDFRTGETLYPDDKGQKYVQQYLDSVQKGYLNNDMSNVTRFKTFIKNKYPKTFAKVIADVNSSGYRGMMDIGVDYKRKLANEIITSSNNQLKYINQFDIIKKLVPANRAAQVKDVGINSLGNLLDEDTLNAFRKLDKMEDKLSKSLTYIVDNNVEILDPSKIKIKGSAAADYQTQSPIKKMMNYLAGGGSRKQLNKALEMNSWYQSQNYKVGKATRNTFDDLSQAYSKDFIGQNFNDAYDYALNRRGSVSVKGMSKKITPERLIWNFAARSADRHFKDLENPKDWLVKIVDNKGKPIDYSNLPVDNKGRRIIDTNKYQFLYEGQTFNKNNLNTKGYQSGLFNDVYKAVNTITSYLNTDVPDPDNPKKTISLGELFEKTDGRIFASIGHDDAKGGVKKKPFNTFKILTNLENQSLFNAYDKIKSPVVRKQVVDFIYGDTKGLRGDKYKEAWINKNVPLITEYIKTGQGLEQTPFKKGLDIFRKPTGTDGPRLGALDVPSMFKRLSPATRKLVGGFGGVVVPEVLFYQLDKRNRMSKGQSEKEAAAGALESGTLGLYNNKVYMDELKKTAKSMGIDSNSFDSAYQLNLLVDRYNQSSATYEKNYEQLLEMGDEKRAEDLKKNFDKYTKNIQDRYSLLANNISDNVMNTVGASPLIMKEGRENITQKQFDKPFFDMQDVALEKLKREAQSVYPIRARKVNPAEGSEGTRFYNMLDFIGQGFKNIALGRANPNLMDLSERQKQERLLKDMTEEELDAYNKDVRGFTYENPITQADLENLLYEQPGLFAGGGIAKIAGVDQGPPPESGPNSQGLSGLFKRAKNI
jgi:hypothetical protein